MATQTLLADLPVFLRLDSEHLAQLLRTLLLRYPSREWATFARFGWRITPSGLVLTLASLDLPQEGDLDPTVPHIAISEQYSLRTALAAESHNLAVAIIHSHPKGCAPRASVIDDDMDSYYSQYFPSFAKDRPYASLIVSELDGQLQIAGRVFFRGSWLHVGRSHSIHPRIAAWQPFRESWQPRSRTARLAAAFGDEAEKRLRRSRVAVIGAGGTGSAAIEVLARAGVGSLVVVDPDAAEHSNLERMHGAFPVHADDRKKKVAVAREHVEAIDPMCEFIGIVGSLPQPEVLDYVTTADVVIGCTDLHHSRLALSDLASRYLLPTLDTGVVLEGEAGNVTGQVIQIVRFGRDDPCALCRQMVCSKRVAQELMPPEEREVRKLAAAQARAEGLDPTPYWQDTQQLNTVGYLTTTAGALAAGYAIGWLTDRFVPPFSRLQMNLVGHLLDVTDIDEPLTRGCDCAAGRGMADQATLHSLITAPDHWPTPILLN